MNCENCVYLEEGCIMCEVNPIPVNVCNRHGVCRFFKTKGEKCEISAAPMGKEAYQKIDEWLAACRELNMNS